MHRHVALPFLFLVSAVGCGSSTPAGTPAEDTGAEVATDAPTDTAVDPALAYENAVRAAAWTKLVKGPSVSGGAKQDDVFFTSLTRGFTASGPGSSIFRTEDGGATWKNVFTHTGTYFRSVLFVDDKHGFAGNLGAGLTPSIDDKNALYETKDGGDTWAAVTTITGADMPGICNLTALDDKHLFAVGRANGPANLLSSSDGGATWTSIDLSAKFSMLIDARFTSPTEGILAGQNADTPAVCTIMHTADGGKTFDTVFASKVPNSLCWKLSFPTKDVGYVSVEDSGSGPPTFGKTTDGGKTWVELPLPTDGSPKAAYPAIGIGFLTDKIGWISSEDPKKPNYRTFDGGLTWEVTPDLTGPVNRFRFLDRNTAYAIGASVWKLTIDTKGI